MKLARKTGESASDVVDYGMVEQPEGCRRFRTLTEEWTSRNAWKIGDSHYHERLVCVPEACDELS